MAERISWTNGEREEKSCEEEAHIKTAIKKGSGVNHRGYPSTSANVRGQLEKLIGTEDSSAEWPAFLRRETTLPLWILPAVQIAVRQGAWRSAADPVAQITFAVRRIAIDLKLSGGNKIAEIEPAEPNEE